MTRLLHVMALAPLAMATTLHADDWYGPYLHNPTGLPMLYTGDAVAIGHDWPLGKLTVVGHGDNDFPGWDTAIYAVATPTNDNRPSYAIYAHSNWGRAGVFDGRLKVSESINGNATTPNHVVEIVNTHTGHSPDVLALQVHSNDSTPGGAINFVTFLNKNGSGLGAIEGNNAGGVKFKTSGADYAEYLQKLDPSETFEPGDVIGVVGGRITRSTAGAQQIMVISTAAAVLGNHPGHEDEEPEDWEEVAFMGQAKVKVTGPVRFGDFLVPSGLDDGTAMAVAPTAIESDQLALVLGTAWEAFGGDSEGLVNAAIGIDQRSTLAAALPQLQELVRERDRRLNELDDRLASLEASVEQLGRVAAEGAH